jgi:hypothetical protein
MTPHEQAARELIASIGDCACSEPNQCDPCTVSRYWRVIAAALEKVQAESFELGKFAGTFEEREAMINWFMDRRRTLTAGEVKECIRDRAENASTPATSFETCNLSLFLQPTADERNPSPIPTPEEVSKWEVVNGALVPPEKAARLRAIGKGNDRE